MALPTDKVNSASEALSQISMVSANFGNAAAFEPLLEDWFRFMGGRAGEVVVVDGGSSPQTHAVYWKLFNEGKIDKLQVIRGEHFENHKDKCYYQEYHAGAIAGKPYILFFKTDTLPYREGHDNWLSEAIQYLERDDTFAVSGAFNIDSKHHEAWPGWYFSHKCSLNFALMKRSSFMKAMEEFAGDYIAGGFRGTSPAASTGQSRFLVEVAFERYIQNNKKYALVRVEDPSWTIFHTNIHGKKLLEVREKYLARVDVERHMNARTYNRVWSGCFYGMPPKRWVNLKWKLSESPLGSILRAAKRLMGKPAARST
jgi:hypothetical protein